MDLSVHLAQQEATELGLKRNKVASFTYFNESLTNWKRHHRPLERMCSWPHTCPVLIRFHRFIPWWWHLSAQNSAVDYYDYRKYNQGQDLIDHNDFLIMHNFRGLPNQMRH